MTPNLERNDRIQNPATTTTTDAKMTQIVLDEPPPNSPSGKDVSPTKRVSNSSNPKSFLKMPSWREIKATTGEPDFNVAILIDDINVLDRHASAMSKPASRCFLTHVVVLNSNSDQVQESVQEWLFRNKIDVDVADLDIGQGLEGYAKMLKQGDVDAVYIVLSPR